MNSNYKPSFTKALLNRYHQIQIKKLTTLLSQHEQTKNNKNAASPPRLERGYLSSVQNNIYNFMELLNVHSTDEIKNSKDSNFFSTSAQKTSPQLRKLTNQEKSEARAQICEIVKNVLHVYVKAICYPEQFGCLPPDFSNTVAPMRAHFKGDSNSSSASFNNKEDHNDNNYSNYNNMNDPILRRIVGRQVLSRGDFNNLHRLGAVLQTLMAHDEHNITMIYKRNNNNNHNAMTNRHPGSANEKVIFKSSNRDCGSEFVAAESPLNNNNNNNKNAESNFKNDDDNLSFHADESFSSSTSSTSLSRQEKQQYQSKFEELWDNSPLARFSKDLFDMAINSSSATASSLVACIIKVEHVSGDALEQLARHSIAFVNHQQQQLIQQQEELIRSENEKETNNVRGSDRSSSSSLFGGNNIRSIESAESVMLKHWGRDVVLQKSKFRNPRLQLPLILEFGGVMDQIVNETRSMFKGRLIDCERLLELKSSSSSSSSSCSTPTSTSKTQNQHQIEFISDDVNNSNDLNNSALHSFFAQRQFKSAVDAYMFLSDDCIPFFTFCKDPVVFEEMLIILRLAFEKIGIPMVPIDDLANIGEFMRKEQKNRAFSQYYDGLYHTEMSENHSSERTKNGNKDNADKLSDKNAYQFNFSGMWRSTKQSRMLDDYRAKRHGYSKNQILLQEHKNNNNQKDDVEDSKKNKIGETESKQEMAKTTNVQDDDEDDEGFWNSSLTTTTTTTTKCEKGTSITSASTTTVSSSKAPNGNNTHVESSSPSSPQKTLGKIKSHHKRHLPVVLDRSTGTFVSTSPFFATSANDRHADREGDSAADFIRRASFERRRFSTKEENDAFSRMLELNVKYHPQLSGGKKVVVVENDEHHYFNDRPDQQYDLELLEDETLSPREKASYFVAHGIPAKEILFLKNEFDLKLPKWGMADPTMKKIVVPYWHHFGYVFLAMQQALYFIGFVRDKVQIASDGGDDSGEHTTSGNTMKLSQSRVRRAEMCDSFIIADQIKNAEEMVHDTIVAFATNKDDIRTQNPNGLVFLPPTYAETEHGQSLRCRVLSLLINTVIDFGITLIPHSLDDKHRQKSLSTVTLVLHRLHPIVEKSSPLGLRLEFITRSMILTSLRYRGLQPTVRLFTAIVLTDVHHVSQDRSSNTTLLQILVECAEQLPHVPFSRRVQSLKGRMASLESVRALISAIRRELAPRELIHRYLELSAGYIEIRDESEFSIWCSELSGLEDMTEDVFFPIAVRLVDVAGRLFSPGFYFEDVSSYGKYSRLFCRKYSTLRDELTNARKVGDPTSNEPVSGGTGKMSQEETEDYLVEGSGEVVQDVDEYFDKFNKNKQQQQQTTTSSIKAPSSTTASTNSSNDQHRTIQKIEREYHEAMDQFATFLKRVIELPDPSVDSLLGNNLSLATTTTNNNNTKGNSTNNTKNHDRSASDLTLFDRQLQSHNDKGFHARRWQNEIASKDDFFFEEEMENNSNNNKNRQDATFANKKNDRNRGLSVSSSSECASSSTAVLTPHAPSISHTVHLPKASALQVYASVYEANFYNNKIFQKKYPGLLDQLWKKLETALLAFPQQKQLPFYQLRDFCKASMRALESEQHCSPPSMVAAAAEATFNFFHRTPQMFLNQVPMTSQTSQKKSNQNDNNNNCDAAITAAANISCKIAVDPYLVDPRVVTASASSLVASYVHEQVQRRRSSSSASPSSHNAIDEAAMLKTLLSDTSIALDERVIAVNTLISSSTASGGYHHDFDSSGLQRVASESSPVGLLYVLRFSNHLVDVLYLNIRTKIESALRAYVLDNLFQCSCESVTSLLRQFSTFCFQYQTVKYDVDLQYDLGSPSAMRTHLHAEFALALLKKAVAHGREERRRNASAPAVLPVGLVDTLAFAMRFAFAIDRNVSPIAGARADGSFYSYMVDLLQDPVGEQYLLAGSSFFKSAAERNEELILAVTSAEAKLTLRYAKEENENKRGAAKKSSHAAAKTLESFPATSVSSSSSEILSVPPAIFAKFRPNTVHAAIGSCLSATIRDRIDTLYSLLPDETKRIMTLFDCHMTDFEYIDIESTYGVKFGSSSSASSASVDKWRRNQLKLTQLLATIRDLVADDCYPQLRQDPLVCDRVSFLTTAMESRKFPDHEVFEVEAKLFGPRTRKALQPTTRIRIYDFHAQRRLLCRSFPDVADNGLFHAGGKLKKFEGMDDDHDDGNSETAKESANNMRRSSSSSFVDVQDISSVPPAFSFKHTRPTSSTSKVWTKGATNAKDNNIKFENYSKTAHGHLQHKKFPQAQLNMNRSNNHLGAQPRKNNSPTFSNNRRQNNHRSAKDQETIQWQDIGNDFKKKK